MAVELPDKVRKAIEEPQFWHLATVNPDGSPQVSTIWIMPVAPRGCPLPFNPPVRLVGYSP